jgi:hypothetical protein
VINYNDFLILLNEGLIKTRSVKNIGYMIEHQIQFMGFDAYINITNKYLYKIEIFNPEYFTDINICELFFNINGNFGYFPNICILYRKNKKKQLKFQKNLKDKYENIDLQNFLSNIKNIDKLEITFEAKFDTGLYKNDVEIPSIVYHLSPTKNRISVLDNGLEPKSNNRKIYHKGRIYLFKNFSDYIKLLNILKSNDRYNLLDEKDIFYDLYEVKLDKEKIILHQDPYFNDGFYTYDNISPKDLVIIKNDL